MMTPCHLLVKQVQKVLKIGTPTNFGSSNSNMTFVFEIDDVLTNYSQNISKLVHPIMLGQGDQIRPLFLKLTTCSLNIQRMTIPCHFLVKQAQKVKNMWVLNVIPCMLSGSLRFILKFEVRCAFLRIEQKHNENMYFQFMEPFVPLENFLNLFDKQMTGCHHSMNNQCGRRQFQKRRSYLNYLTQNQWVYQF